MRRLFRKFGHQSSNSGTEDPWPTIKEKPALLEETQFDGRPIRKHADGSIKAAISEGWMSCSDFEEFQAYAYWRKIRRRKKRPVRNSQAQATA